MNSGKTYRVLVLIASLLAFVQCKGADLSSLLGEQVGVVEKIRKLANDHDYSSVYDLLAKEYTDAVGRDIFVEKEKNSNWSFDIKEIGTVNEFDRLSYFPIVILVHNGTKENKIHCVLFFSKERSVWRMLNFPFLQPDLPEYGVIPDCFEGHHHVGTMPKGRR